MSTSTEIPIDEGSGLTWDQSHTAYALASIHRGQEQDHEDLLRIPAHQWCGMPHYTRQTWAIIDSIQGADALYEHEHPE